MTSKRGGAVLGRGRGYTVVYEYHDVPSHAIACIGKWNSEGGAACSPDLATPVAPMPESELAKLNKAVGSTLALKDIQNVAEIQEELKNNRIIFKVFGGARGLDLTSLHPVVEYVRVGGGVSYYPNKVLVGLRRFDGDLGLLRRMQLANVWTLARDVLRFLAILHASGYVHMDIKPENIYCNANARKFVLGDYNIIEPFEKIVFKLRKHWSNNFSQGTAGYMSPMLNVDDAIDDGTGVLFKMQRMLRESGLILERDDLVDYMKKKKRFIKKNVRKIDMHSLAITLYDVCFARGIDPPPNLWMFMKRLVMMDDKDFQTCERALEIAASNVDAIVTAS